MTEHLCPGCAGEGSPHLRHEEITRGPYERSPYTRASGIHVSGTHVHGTTYEAEVPAMREKRGRVRIPTNPSHHLSYEGRRWHKDQAKSTRMRIVTGHVKTHGYANTVRMLNALRIKSMSARHQANSDLRSLEAWGKKHGYR
jgi:hypothetical protein